MFALEVVWDNPRLNIGSFPISSSIYIAGGKKSDLSYPRETHPPYWKNTNLIREILNSNDRIIAVCLNTIIPPKNIEVYPFLIP